ncbi:MAG: glycoside hydrolase family 108 protein [Desulfuromonadaceae bacterium]
MALFYPAYAATIKHEGGYANDAADKGGETYMGISRKNWPGWNGWPDVDKLKQNKDFPKCLNANADLQGRVRDFYKRNFWTPVMDEITDQELVNWLFDKGVNMGIGRAYKLLQRALHVDEDGVIGMQTRAQIAQSDPAELLEACRFEAKRFYTNLALKDPTQTRFLHGWLARA